MSYNPINSIKSLKISRLITSPWFWQRCPYRRSDWSISPWRRFVQMKNSLSSSASGCPTHSRYYLLRTYFPLIATVFSQILRVRIQDLVFYIRPGPLQQSLPLFDVLMTEVWLKLKLLQLEHPSYQGVYIKDIEEDQQEQQNREDVEESFSKNWHNIGLSHDLREGRHVMVNHQ